MKAMVLAVSLLALLSFSFAEYAGAAGPMGGKQGGNGWGCPAAQGNQWCQGKRLRDGSCARGMQSGTAGKGANRAGQSK